jgi:5,10-methylenetetrahydromethanopterin reductase
MLRAMKVSLRVSPFAPIPEVIAFAQRVEAAGFDGIGLLDSQMINRELFVTMGLVAAATSRIRVISAVTNPLTRHVSVIASAAATIDDVAQGRVEVWIGRGFSAVNLAGMRDATTAQMRDSVVQLRRLIAGEWDAIPGAHSRMRIGGRHIPVYLAAQGPRTIRLAGEVADGLLLAGSFDPAHWQDARDLVADGAKSTGRDASEVDVCVSLLTCIRRTREEALHEAGPLLVLRLDEPEWLETQGINAHGESVPQALREMYPDPMHSEDPERALAICESVPYELRSQIADAVGLIGSPEDCVERLRVAASHGVTNLYMRTVDTMSFPAAEVEAYERVIGPAVRNMG